MRRITQGVKWTGIGALALALAGCISFGAEPPPSLLTLTPTSLAPAGSGASGTGDNAIAILEPEAVASIAVLRVPVQIDDTNIAYVKDATWIERPTRLFRRLLAETIRTRSNRLVVDMDESSIAPTIVIGGIMRNFGYDARDGSVVVRFDATRRLGEGRVETRRFESVVPGVVAEAAPVGDALNRAANDVAGQVADWIG